MTERPNLKREVLDYVIRQHAKGETANLRDLADDTGHSIDSLANKESHLYPAVNCGTTPVLPWPWERSEAQRLYESWGVDPPDEIDAVDWVDEQPDELEGRIR